jgi:serine/threonine protein kinase
MSLEPESLQPGTEIFGYVISRTLGRGGMGTVYLAQQVSLNRQVAVKVLSSKRSRNPQQVESFLREARNAGRLNHPNLVLVHAVHQDELHGIYCYSMEYVPGTTLTKLVAEKGALSRNTALHITYQIAKALGHAHGNDLVHRDVKPDNILVTGNAVAKLADLGLVRDRLEGIVSTSAKRLSLVGTPEFSSIEQSRNPQRATPASDVYSLGACLYFMLTGNPPFGGETVIDLIVNTATEPLFIPKDFPEDCEDILAHMITTQPHQRYANGNSVVIALEALAKGAPIPFKAGKPSPARDDETLSDESAVNSPPLGSPTAPLPHPSVRRRRVRRRR